MTGTVDPLHDVPASTWRQWLARQAYSLLLASLKPAYLLRLWLRGRVEPLYRHKVLERLGDYSDHRQQHSGRWVGDGGRSVPSVDTVWSAWQSVMPETLGAAAPR